MRQPPSMFRGDSWVWPFQVVLDVATGRLYTADSPGLPPPGSVPQDLSSYSIWVTVKHHGLDPDPQAVWQGTIGQGVTITQALSGLAKSIMPPSATLNFPDGPVPLVYDIQTKDSAGVVLTVESGVLTVNPDVTRATS